MIPVLQQVTHKCRNLQSNHTDRGSTHVFRWRRTSCSQRCGSLRRQLASPWWEQAAAKYSAEETAVGTAAAADTVAAAAAGTAAAGRVPSHMDSAAAGRVSDLATT